MGREQRMLVCGFGFITLAKTLLGANMMITDSSKRLELA